jgi:hypothetical protein
VKDEKAFRGWAGNYELEIIEGQGGFGFIGNDADGAGWPTNVYNEKTEDWDDVDFFGEVSKHLAEDAVAIFMEAGAEKARYIIGYAVAINAKGERKEVCINDIYGLAKQLTNKPAEITVAKY